MVLSCPKLLDPARIRIKRRSKGIIPLTGIPPIPLRGASKAVSMILN
jgi:hypothetical protein